MPSECPAGTASLGGTTLCTLCQLGTYANMTGSASCATCPAGSSCLDIAGAPVTCPSGTYSLSGEDLCSACPSGTYSQGGTSSCLACPVGKYCADSAADPVDCQDGYYSAGGNVRRPSLVCTLMFAVSDRALDLYGSKRKLLSSSVFQG